MSEITDALESCGALRFGEFTLASGAKSNYYIDIKKASTDPRILRLIARLMAAEMASKGMAVDRIAGVVLGSVPLAAALALETGIPYVMVRKEKKDHGTSKLIEGDLSPWDRVLVVEDVITTAGSSIAAIATLRENGAVVTDILSVIDRQGGGREALEAIGVRLSSLAKGSEIAGAR